MRDGPATARHGTREAVTVSLLIPRMLVPIGPAGYAGWAAIVASYVLVVRGRRGQAGLFWVALGLHLVMLDVALNVEGQIFQFHGFTVTPEYMRELVVLRGPRRLIAAQIVPVFASGPLIFLHLRTLAGSIPRPVRRQLCGAYFALADILLLIGWLALLVRR